MSEREQVDFLCLCLVYSTVVGPGVVSGSPVSDYLPDADHLLLDAL